VRSLLADDGAWVLETIHPNQEDSVPVLSVSSQFWDGEFESDFMTVVRTRGTGLSSPSRKTRPKFSTYSIDGPI